MAKRRDVFTTGEVARICSVAPRTVSKWFDTGQLHGYRIPGSKDRRIPRAQLIRFMKANGIPLDQLEGDRPRLVLLGGDNEFGNTLRTSLNTEEGYEVHTAMTAFEAGVLVERLRPQALVIDVSLPDVDPKKLVGVLTAQEPLDGIKLIAYGPSMSDSQGQALMRGGFTACLKTPFPARQLLESLERFFDPPSSK